MTAKPQEYSTYKTPGTPGKKIKPLSERIRDFWGAVKKEGHPKGCHEWQLSCLTSGGYGQFNINGTIWRTHVLAWVLLRGDIPDGIYVCHKCDNPKCVNIDHLFLGTQKQNMHDMIQKKRDRHSHGEDRPTAKWTNEQVSRIKRIINSGEFSNAEIARMFNTDRSHIGKIAKGRLWRHVAPEPTLATNQSPKLNP